MRKVDGWACETCGMVYDGRYAEEKIVQCSNCRIDMCENCSTAYLRGKELCEDCIEDLEELEEDE